MEAQQQNSHVPGGNFTPPTLSLPKGGGAIRGLGEKFSANPVRGTGSFSIPFAASPGRSGFGPQLSLSYDSGAGNGPFGFGWSLAVPAITRKTDQGLPRYQDALDSDVYLLSGSEDLVPKLDWDGTHWQREPVNRVVNGHNWRVECYQPRIEGPFARIERWSDPTSGEVYWRSISRGNITTLYGRTAEARIADPADPRKVFSWLACESYDDRGNAMLYQYKPEDSQQVDLTRVEEGHRTPLERGANRYLKRIRYANRTPRQEGEDLSLRSDWLFEVVFDYGDHDLADPLPQDALPWPVRMDAFSSYRSCFEVRTYRLCRRILMYHHFPDEPVGANCLVKSLDLEYDQNPHASFLVSATQSGYVRSGPHAYLKESLPPLEFGYSQPKIDPQVHVLDPGSLENMPAGLTGGYRLVDLDGEGLSGVLAEQGPAWFYKPNLGGQFGPPRQVSPLPSLASGAQQFLDLAGDGSMDLVQFSGAVPGFYERGEEGGWAPFRAFTSLPDIDWNDPNLRFIDLNGDGHSDVLLAGDQVFTWYPSLAEEGFAPAGQVFEALDDKLAPALVFSDEVQSIFLADMSGDGLTDLVRIRNGEVCYWPNLGYGRFGRQVVMGGTPPFDPPDHYDPARIRLADLDGSGTTDLVYLGGAGVGLYFNQAGNRFSAPQILSAFPAIDSLAGVQVVDLLGSGTACLVWSSPLPGEAGRQMRYIDLMGGQKPHLLVSSHNNLGTETTIQYTPSTKFYLADRLAGVPWVTRLPFPVQVVERVEIADRVSKNRFVTRYAYHHGYFDGAEREFRGFGMVEQWDTEEFAILSNSTSFPNATNLDAASHVPPAYTRTWYHTGAYRQGGRISRHFEGEYYEEADPSQGPPVLSEAQLAAMRLDDTLLPQGVLLPDGTRLAWSLSPDEAREACRALKGSLLRQEVYGLDGSQAEDRPYHVSERNYTLELYQPQIGNRHTVFFSHKRETLDFYYERALYAVSGQQLADPRVHHTLELDVDYYGNSLRSVTVGYGRRHPDPAPLFTPQDRAQQARLLATLTENQVTNAVDLLDAWRTPLVCETSTSELVKVAPAGTLPQITNLFGFEEMCLLVDAASDGVHDLAYEDGAHAKAVQAAPYRRLVEHLRVLYRNDDLSGPLPFGQLQSRGLPDQRFRLELTPGLVTQVYGGRVTDTMLAEGGYIHYQGDSDWWAPAGQMLYSPNETDTPALELSYAADHFFLPCRYLDPFGSTTHVRYDGYDLLLLETEDALHNRATAGERSAGGVVTPALDYRVLQPALLTDPNRNRSAAAFSALGLVVGTALMGKSGETLGDTLAGFTADLPPATIQAHLTNPFTAPEDILQGATTRLVYDLFAYHNTRSNPQPQPVVTYTLARETHAADLPPHTPPPIQHSFTYSDGFGRVIQKKIQAEPGPLTEGGSPVSPRWVGSGWEVYNNKGKPVRKYEPFFSATQAFEFGLAVGVSPTLCYDPQGRVVVTLRADHSYEKAVFDPWGQTIWDPNDTVLQADPRNDPDVGDYFKRLPAADFLPTWYSARIAGGMGAAAQSAAQKAAQHAGTPQREFYDTLGRPFLQVTDAGGGQQIITRSLIDVEGQVQHVTDANGRVALDYTAHPGALQAPGYDIAGHLIYQKHIDGGERRALLDIYGKPIYQWDGRDTRLHTHMDAMRRPVELLALPSGGVETTVERSVYGETQGDALNLRGRLYQQYDGAGLLTHSAYDFKGNLLTTSRQLPSAYHTAPDWSGAVAFDPEVYTRSTSYDALNRPHQISEPDGSLVALAYNQANLVESIQARAGSAGALASIVANLDYNAKGQRILIEYGNGVRSEYVYDPQTFRMSSLQTRRGTDLLQGLAYNYDPIGNLTATQDGAQQTIFFNNAVVTPDRDYSYDAAYRLTRAAGREHIGLAGQPQTSWDDAGRVGLTHPNDGNAMRAYSEQYSYDEIGNLLSLVHQAASGNWTRLYHYDQPNPIPTNNHLSSVEVGASSDQYLYDPDGNLVQINLLQMGWDEKDRLASADLPGGGKVYYSYDASGQRVRKVVDRSNGTRQKLRISLGGYEVYRAFNGAGGAINLERTSLHIMDGGQRVALVETRTQGADGLPTQVQRYQLADQLGSVSLELDGGGAIISYEEYYPFGSTSYQAGPNVTETNLKRYRFTGMERDSETGFNYHSARYYLPWLGRWASVDPLTFSGTDPGKAPGMAASPYQYANNRPTGVVDRTGLDGTTATLGPVQVTDFRYRFTQPWVGRYTLPSLLGEDRDSASTLSVHHLSAGGFLRVPELGKGGPFVLGDVDFAARASASGGAHIAGVGLLRTGEIGSGLWASLYVRGVVDTPLTLDPRNPASIGRALPEGSGHFSLLGNVSAGGFQLGTITGSATLGDHRLRLNSEFSAMGLASLDLRATATLESAGSVGLDASARLRVFGIPSISAHGTGTLETSGAYQFHGTFSGYVPPFSYTTGNFGLHSGESPTLTAHVFGITYLPSIDVKDPSPIPAAERAMLHLPADPSVPSGAIAGYTFTRYQHGAFTHIGLGVTLSTHPAAAFYLSVPFSAF